MMNKKKMDMTSLGMKKGGMAKKSGYMKGGMTKKMSGYNKGGLACGASNEAERPIKGVKK